MKNIIVCDLDGTLCNVEHRRKFVDGSQEKNWEAFYNGISEDVPNMWCVRLVESLMLNAFRVAFVTARPELCTGVSEEWLIKHLDRACDEQWNLHMVRPDGCYIGDDVLKRAWLNTMGFKDRILFVIDDRARVVKMWREEGLTVLQCSDWEERAKEAKNGNQEVPVGR